jgi:hypothetical protein
MTPLVMLLAAVPALAQPADCPSVGVGPPMALDAFVGTNRHHGGSPIFVGVGLGSLPSQGTLCYDAAPPPADVLHGPPAPGGLLRGMQ